MKEGIEFRVWDRKAKTMLYENNLCIKMSKGTMFSPNAFFRQSRVAYEWLQWTGLKDSDDHKIYLGDFLKVKLKKGDSMAQVIFTEAAFKIRYLDGRGIFDLYDILADFPCYVEGNMYENVEVFKKHSK